MNHSNFLPEDYVQKKSQRRVNAIFFALFVLVAAAVAVGVIMTERRQSRVDLLKAEQDAEVAAVQQSLTTLEEIQSRRSQILDKARLSATLIDPIPQSLILALITNRLPDDVVLSIYKMDTREIARTAAPVAAPDDRRSRRNRNQQNDEEAQAPPLPPESITTLELQGLAENDLLVADFVKNLDNSTLLDQVSLHFSREDEQPDGTVLRSFRITARVNSQRDNIDTYLQEALFSSAQPVAVCDPDPRVRNIEPKP
ncbi:MAG: PilN domain-containing protein [Sedimentisphaerales bacterium]|nr:PilN domain-containing protein [Sedimentisphaerales bacterium]